MTPQCFTVHMYETEVVKRKKWEDRKGNRGEGIGWI